MPFVQNVESTVECLTNGIQPCYCLAAASATATAGRKPATRQGRKENRHMSANFFKLPESDKRKIWAALLKEWAAKKAANRANG